MGGPRSGPRHRDRREQGLKESLNLTFYPLLWQAGGEVFSDNGKSVAFDSAAGRKALGFARTLIQKRYADKSLVTTSPAAEQTRIAQNKVACVWHYPIPELTGRIWSDSATSPRA